MTELFEELVETPKVSPPDWDTLDTYFDEPSLDGCFTIYDLMDRYGWGRNKARQRVQKAIEDGRAEYVGSGQKGKCYYRWTDVGNAG